MVRKGSRSSISNASTPRRRRRQSAAIFGLTTTRGARFGLASASGRFGLKIAKWE